MGRDTVFGSAVHLEGPNLDLEGLAALADQRGMQGLVHIRLRHGDIILEPAGNGLVHLMDDAQRRIAVLDGVHDDAHREQVVDLVNALVLIHHLLVDAEQMLDAAFHLAADTRLLHGISHLVKNGIDKCFLGPLAHFHLGL